jgi:NADH dehydrogenase [ubiquinone] 1 alpha subcomplex assembly factor 5
MLGGTTLQELRIACTAASQEREGGVSPRLSPLAQVRDAGNLLTRAGLAIPTVDVDEISVMYRDPVQLVTHLRGMAEGNALKQRRVGLPCDTALATAAAYIGLFGGRSGDSTGESLEAKEGGDVSDAHEDGVPATFQVVYMTGWAPDPSAQRGAAKRGSATVSFSDLTSALGGKEAES